MAAATEARGRRGARSTRKTSIRLDTAVYQEMASCITKRGVTQTAFVEEAIRSLLREWRRTELTDEYEAAAKDPAFMTEMSAVDAAFETAVSDGLD